MINISDILFLLNKYIKIVLKIALLNKSTNNNNCTKQIMC